MDKTPAPSVGDAHAGNFGLWRDAQTRLVWGVNDFDEAARLLWPLDLVRLAASVLAAVEAADASEVAGAVLEGYLSGLSDPRAIVIERKTDFLWLRDAFISNDDERQKFWKKLDKAKAADCDPAALETPLLTAFGRTSDVLVARRQAGVGSLRRPRFTASGVVNSGPFAAEIKAALPSCWRDGREAGLAQSMAHGPARSPDPALRYDDSATVPFVIRRLAPNYRKLEFGELEPKLSGRHRRALLGAMGMELASLHVAKAGDERDAIMGELSKLPERWLSRAASRVADWTVDEWRGFGKSH
ncbi:MAG TPA: DUF2252 family protein [Roseiarcus sp.]|nr:DUF2252 family protein [Roseiarcus sp.]